MVEVVCYLTYVLIQWLYSSVLSFIRTGFTMCLLLAKCFRSLFYFKGSWGSLKMDYKQIWLGTSDGIDFSSAKRVFIDSDWNVLLKFSASHLVRVDWFLSVSRCGHHPTFIYWTISTPSDLSCFKLWLMDIPSYWYGMAAYAEMWGIIKINNLQACSCSFMSLTASKQDFTVAGA